MRRLPPTRIVRGATAVRTLLQALTRRMVPPEISLLELVSGFMATHAVYAVARLGIADALANGPLNAADVAVKIQADIDGTGRLLRACTAFGVFQERSDGRFTLTPLGDALRSEAPDSMLPVILMLGDPRYQAAWGQLPRAVASGAPGAEAVLGEPLWDYLDHNPDFAATFDDAMARLSALDWPAVAAAYDFAQFSTIVDIGGGSGQLLAFMLQASPRARGVLLERSNVAEEARNRLREAGVLPRCRVESGSIFETAPSDGDLYVVRRVIHDFDDAQATEVLTTIRRHMPAGARLLLLESIIPPGNAPHFGKLLDLDMLVFVGGRERTEQEFTALLDRAGLRVTRFIPTISTLSLIEAAPGR